MEPRSLTSRIIWSKVLDSSLKIRSVERSGKENTWPTGGMTTIWTCRDALAGLRNGLVPQPIPSQGWWNCMSKCCRRGSIQHIRLAPTHLTTLFVGCVVRPSGCLALAQSKYLDRHNATLKVLFFEMLRDLQLCEGVPPWYSPVAPKPLYDSPDALAFWDIPMFAEHNHVRSNQVDVRVIDHKQKRIYAIEMSCPWIETGRRRRWRRLSSTPPCGGNWNSNSQPTPSSSSTSLLMCWEDGP